MDMLLTETTLTSQQNRLPADWWSVVAFKALMLCKNSFQVSVRSLLKSRGWPS